MSMAMMGQKQVMEVDKMDFAAIPATEFALPPAIKALVADKKAREAEEKTKGGADAEPAKTTAPAGDSGAGE
jgi:hypothetical protein